MVRSITMEKYRDPLKCVTRETESILGNQEAFSKAMTTEEWVGKNKKSGSQMASPFDTYALLMSEIYGSKDKDKFIFSI